jgi:hypothetical protein
MTLLLFGQFISMMTYFKRRHSVIYTALAFAATDWSRPWKLHNSIHFSISAATSSSSTAATADTTAVHNNQLSAIQCPDCASATSS